MSGRNWMTRRLLIETIKADPEYQNGQYTTQPKLTKLASLVYATGTNGGDIALQTQAPTRAAADALVDKALAQPFAADANDFLYQWDASRDYNPEPALGKIKARVLVINSADDERNPPHTGILDAALKKIPTARLLLIPASAETAGHGTTGSKAKMYAKDLAAFLDALPKS
jgi:homoserine O-acetyltransferase